MKQLRKSRQTLLLGEEGAALLSTVLGSVRPLGRVWCQVELEAEETTAVIKGLKTSLVQRGLVVSANREITEGYNKSGTKY